MASPGRALAAVVAVFLVGVLVGRLVLERTGIGLAILAFVLPVAFLVGAATLGAGRASALLGVFLGTALLVRVIALQGTGWIVLLLVGPVALSVYIVAQTVRVMMQREGKGKGS